MKFKCKVPDNIKPDTYLVSYLTQRFTYHTREQWVDKIKNGSITFDSRVAAIDDFISPGLTIYFDPGEFDEPPANLCYSIVYEDEWFLGISKPGNLLVHRAGRSFRNNLIYQLRHVHKPPFEGSHTVNRLDRDTSGVVLVAKSPTAQAALSTQFADGAVEKEYVAIVKGTPDPSLKRITYPIGKDKDSSIPYKFRIDTKGKDAVTQIRSSEKLGSCFSQLIVSPFTGRTHQIRIHLAAIGTPVVGDKLYGMSEEDYKKWRENPAQNPHGLLFYRHALHCRSISFCHPYLLKKCTIESPLPDEMMELGELLKKR